MPRVKRGTTNIKKRRKLLKDVKGYKWGRKKLVRLAKTARTKAGAHAYIDRKKKKRVMRSLWQIKINAFVREHGLSYSRFINLLRVNKVEVDRKILADMAVNNKEALKALINKVNQ
ncbi:MAG: 50S ribosomal protein L20 [Patescibacteria group bacterium]|jgi:large subunit ribosomal protein L20